MQNKWNEMSKIYTEKIEEIKAKNARIFKDRNRILKKKLKKQELSQIKKSPKSRGKILEGKIKTLDLTKQKSEIILRNLEEHNKKQEEKRLKLEKNTFLKSN